MLVLHTDVNNFVYNVDFTSGLYYLWIKSECNDSGCKSVSKIHI